MMQSGMNHDDVEGPIFVTEVLCVLAIIRSLQIEVRQSEVLEPEFSNDMLIQRTRADH